MSDENNESFVIDSFDMRDETLKGWDGEGGGPPEVPPDEYLLECDSVTSKTTKAGDGKNIIVDWRIVGGDYDGKTFKQWYYYTGERLKMGHKRRIAHVFRDALGVPMTDQGHWDVKDALGRRMYGTVSHESSESYDPVTQAKKTFINIKLSSERPAEDQPQAAAPPPPPPKAASAPPSKPPASPPPANRPPAKPPVAANTARAR